MNNSLLAVANTIEIFDERDFPKCQHNHGQMILTKWPVGLNSIQYRIQCPKCLRNGRALPHAELSFYVDLDSLPDNKHAI